MPKQSNTGYAGIYLEEGYVERYMVSIGSGENRIIRRVNGLEKAIQVKRNLQAEMRPVFIREEIKKYQEKIQELEQELDYIEMGK